VATLDIHCPTMCAISLLGQTSIEAIREGIRLRGVVAFHS